MADEYQKQLQRQHETVGRRLEAARDNVVVLEIEQQELEVALRVHERITGSTSKSGGNGPARKAVLSQQKLIFLILDNAIPKGLSLSEICNIAEEQYSRIIPPGSAGAVLSNAKKAGQVKHSDGKWRSVLVDKPTSGEPSPEAPSSDGSMSAELALPSG